MPTPNLDASGQQWVPALAKFNFWLEYQKGWDNTVADVLSQITTHLGPEAVWSILDGVTLGAAQRAEGDDPTIVEGDQVLEREVRVTTGWVLVEMHVTDWATAQREDLVLDAVLHWLEAKKKTDLRTLLGEHASGEEGQMVWRNSSEFHDSPGCHLSTLHAQRGEWGSTALCHAEGTLDCHFEWVS